MLEASGPLMVQVLEIVWINLLLSGDNAVLIALACRSLPRKQRYVGILLGTCAAIAMRILFTLVVVTLLTIPLLKLVGGATLLWIAINLLDEQSNRDHVPESPTVWRAVRTIAIADAVMSLDNVLAVVAAAGGSLWLIVFGLALSIPLITFGAALVMNILDHFPILVWASAALLGWVAAQLAASDPALAPFSRGSEHLSLYVGSAGAIIVIVIGWLLRWSRNADYS